MSEPKTAAAFDRETVRGWIEECTREGLSVEDALPDTLIATSQALGLTPPELRTWIFDHAAVTRDGEIIGTFQPANAWSAASLANWARRVGFAKEKREGND